MLKLVLLALITILIVAFSLANSHHVFLSVVVGAPLQIRLVFLLLSTYFLGIATPIFYRLFKTMRDDKRMKREKELEKAIQQVENDIVR